MSDPERFDKNHLQLNDFLFDFSKNRITDETKRITNIALAEKAALKIGEVDYSQVKK